MVLARICQRGYPHHHQADGDAFLFSFTDKIIQDKLGLYRERRGNVTH